MGEIKRVMESISAEAQYDENAKELLSQKPFLANILTRTVDEFKGVNPKEVEELIEGEPRINEIQVDPGYTNQQMEKASIITGMNTESKVRNEGVRFFDILFHVRTPDGITQVIVNVEAQKENPTEYDIEMRGLFYVARLISSQLEREFMGKDYNSIQKVYSIWVYLNCKENTMNRIHMFNEDMIGKSRWKNMYDLMNVVIVRLKKSLDEDLTHELHRLLGAMFLTDIEIQKKEEIIKKEFGIEIEGRRKELMGTMCNLGEGIKEEALNQGECRKLIELIIKKILKHKELHQIADELEESEQNIRSLYEATLAEAPDFDVDKIFERVL